MTLNDRTMKALEELTAIVEDREGVEAVNELRLSELIADIGGVEAVFSSLDFAENDDPDILIDRLVKRYVPADAVHYASIRQAAGDFFWSAAAGVEHFAIPPLCTISRLSSRAADVRFPLPVGFQNNVDKRGETRASVLKKDGSWTSVNEEHASISDGHLSVHRISDFFAMPSLFGKGANSWQVLCPNAVDALTLDTPIVVLGPEPARPIAGDTAGNLLRSGFVWESAALVSSGNDEREGLLHSQFLVAKSVTMLDELAKKLSAQSTDAANLLWRRIIGERDSLRAMGGAYQERILSSELAW